MTSGPLLVSAYNHCSVCLIVYVSYVMRSTENRKKYILVIINFIFFLFNWARSFKYVACILMFVCLFFHSNLNDENSSCAVS